MTSQSDASPIATSLAASPKGQTTLSVPPTPIDGAAGFGPPTRSPAPMPIGAASTPSRWNLVGGAHSVPTLDVQLPTPSTGNLAPVGFPPLGRGPSVGTAGTFNPATGGPMIVSPGGLNSGSPTIGGGPPPPPVGGFPRLPPPGPFGITHGTSHTTSGSLGGGGGGLGGLGSIHAPTVSSGPAISLLPDPSNAAASTGGTMLPPATGFYADDSYRLWLAHAPQLYAFCCTHVLERPSHTVTWLGDSQRSIPLRDYSVAQIAVSTNSPDVNYVCVYSCFVPCDVDDTEAVDEGELEEFAQLPGSFDEVAPLMQRHCRVVHDGPVTFVASMPQRPQVIAARGRGRTVSIFDIGRRRHEPEDATAKPDLTLRGHKSGGYGVAWSPLVEGRLATAGSDGAVMMYELESIVEQFGTTGGGLSAMPSLELHGHHDAVEAVSFHCLHKSLLISCSIDGMVNLWDIRAAKAQQCEEVHKAAVHSVQFHPSADFLVATTSADRTCRVWDIRRFTEPVAELVGHTAAVHGIKWAPFNDTVLLTYGADATVCVWDLSRPSNCEDDNGLAAPELVFRHNGHLSRVREADWAPFDEAEFVVASTDDNNLLQLWGPHSDIINDDPDLDNYNTDVI